jgi:hypothetical protein
LLKGVCRLVSVDLYSFGQHILLFPWQSVLPQQHKDPDRWGTGGNIWYIPKDNLIITYFVKVVICHLNQLKAIQLKARMMSVKNVDIGRGNSEKPLESV